MSSSMLVLQVDTELANHLALAIQVYRYHLERQGAAEPVALAQLQDAATQVVRSGQQWSISNVGLAHAQDGLHERELLSPRDIARLTGLSLSTVRRRIRDGSLPAHRQGRLVRVRRQDLDAYCRSS